MTHTKAHLRLYNIRPGVILIPSEYRIESTETTNPIQKGKRERAWGKDSKRLYSSSDIIFIVFRRATNRPTTLLTTLKSNQEYFETSRKEIHFELWGAG